MTEDAAEGQIRAITTILLGVLTTLTPQQADQVLAHVESEQQTLQQEDLQSDTPPENSATRDAILNATKGLLLAISGNG